MRQETLHMSNPDQTVRRKPAHKELLIKARLIVDRASAVLLVVVLMLAIYSTQHGTSVLEGGFFIDENLQNLATIDHVAPQGSYCSLNTCIKLF